MFLFYLLFGIISVDTVLSAKSCSETSDTACCTHGNPYTTKNGQRVSCGDGYGQTSCPEGHVCFAHKSNRWSACCPHEAVIPEQCSASSITACCIHGDPLTNENGQQVSCGRGSPQPACPADYSCSVSEVDKWAVCCLSEKQAPAYVAPPAGYTGLRLQTVCLHVDPACAQMHYRMIDGAWYRVCDIQRPGCRKT
ncbi:uncharacterized protein LOC132565667 [Ylistrum balloti]|uniref:uncharacterized protein LOC132565667 n=1 Tax=Ylistrum balloti TaxID=509963 RepID=UPI002905D4AD|nr:uncharacterized protein LOC132565667 [Ylistrum balloti]